LKLLIKSREVEKTAQKVSKRKTTMAKVLAGGIKLRKIRRRSQKVKVKILLRNID